MKLAEALAERADVQGRLAALRVRIAANLVVQEGDEPGEDPRELLVEATALSDRLEALIQGINRVNSTTELGSGTITDAIARRDVLGQKRRLYTEAAAAAAGSRMDRYSRSEIRSVAVVPARELQAEADRLSKTYRELDVAIQASNWSTDIEV